MIRPALRLQAFRSGLLLGSLLLGPARSLHAEGSVAYKFERYREDDGRMAVETHAVRAEQDLGRDFRLKLGGVIDTLAGATPTGQPISDGSDQVPLAQISDRRKAWDLSLDRQFARFKPALGYAHSRESDYVSHGLSLNSLVDFNQKNTTLLLGAAGASDRVRVFYRNGWDHKQSRDFVAGITQLLDANTSLSLNLTWGRASGYLSDPYKLVEKNIEVFPDVFLPLTFSENRPDQREKRVVFAALHRHFKRVNAALDATYRYYDDTFGIRSHTVELAWFQRLGSRFILRPGFRYYTQSAAEFYVYDLNNSALDPGDGQPRPAGPFYSSDYRLSQLDSRTWGLKAIWTAADWLQIDAAYERYAMRGSDRVTPRSAYPDADIVTVGARLSW